MDRDDTRKLLNEILVRQGKQPVASDEQTLRDASFRSLDFSELALRVEMVLERELHFDAASLRRIDTVGDALSFFEEAGRGA